MYFNIERKEAPYYLTKGTGLSPVPHMHTHVEMVFILKGKSLCAADEKKALAAAGDVFISFPNQIHYYDDLEPAKHYIIIFSPDICPEFEKIFSQGVPECPVLKGAGSQKKIKSIVDGVFREKSKGPFGDVAVRARLLLLLCELMPELKIQKRTGCDGNTLKRILSYCYENYKTSVSLEVAAASLGFSKYYISHLFQEKLGMGFKEYINSMRVQAACDLLHVRGKTITEIAYDVGFENPRTFNRCFLAVKHMTPRQYRALPAEERLSE